MLRHLNEDAMAARVYDALTAVLASGTRPSEYAEHLLAGLDGPVP